MKYPQPAHGEDREDPFFYIKSAEKVFNEFIDQVTQKQARGFVSEVEHKKVFSFETYLRETGHEPDAITAYCKHAASVNLMQKLAEKRSKFWIMAAMYFLKGFLPLAGVALAVALILYLLIATLLLIFGISLWSGRGFYSFTLISTLVVLGYILIKLFSGKRKGGKSTPLYVIKYSDADELSFTKANSRLFVK